ncbi:MAG: anaerobic glycerol-3-phosphate dehydrogenase subunit C [Actinomycetota bacterium]
MELIRESLDHCVKCTICESFCPVSNATPLFPGPKYVGPQAERFRSGDISFDVSLDYCSGCGICTQVCPQGVKIAEINARARANMKAQRGIPLRDKVISRPATSARLAMPVTGLANWALGNWLVRGLLERTMRIHRRAPLPRFARRSFRRWVKTHDSPAGRRKVVFFHGCSTNYFEPRLGMMAVAILEHNDIEVVVPAQGCCGLPLQSNGLFDDARKYVKRLSAALAPYARAGYDIVATSTSCGLMLKREAREILDSDDPDLEVVSERMFDICEYLVDLRAAGELRTDFDPVPMTVPYHAPCQQRGHSIGSPALDLFALVPGLLVQEGTAQCCGIAGTYGLKAEKYDIAMEVGRPLFESVSGGDPDVVACDSETCRWQITHATGIPSVHPVEILHRAYGLRVESSS